MSRLRCSQDTGVRHGRGKSCVVTCERASGDAARKEGCRRAWLKQAAVRALSTALRVGRRLYAGAEENHRFFLERISHDLKTKSLLDPKNQNALFRYLQEAQRAFNLDAIEVYSAKAQRLSQANFPEFMHVSLSAVSADDLQKEIHPKGFRSISEPTDIGELFRTIGTVPFGIKPSEAEAYVVLTDVIPTELSKSMSAIAKGFEEYQQIELLKKGGK